MAAIASAEFEPSSPEDSKFSDSPSACVMRQARAECDSAFFFPFEDSPDSKCSVASDRAAHSSRYGPSSSSADCQEQRLPSAEERILLNIAASHAAEDSDCSDGVESELSSNADNSEDYGYTDDSDLEGVAPCRTTTSAQTLLLRNATAAPPRHISTPFPMFHSVISPSVPSHPLAYEPLYHFTMTSYEIKVIMLS